jgi:transposase
VFPIDRGRGGAVVEVLLGSRFAGVVRSDRWSAYSRFPAERRALCYAHLLWRGEESPDRKAAALCRELNRCWAVLWTFARVDGVERTNNAAEQAPRPVVLWRKGAFGSDSEAGSRLAERLLTGVASCRQQGRRLLDFLVAPAEAALRGMPAPSLLPAPQGG